MMAWRRIGDKPYYLNQCWPSSLTHICGTRGIWVNMPSMSLVSHSTKCNYQINDYISPGHNESFQWANMTGYHKNRLLTMLVEHYSFHSLYNRDCKTSIGIKAWMINCILIKGWYAITHSCPKPNFGLTTAEYRRVITPTPYMVLTLFATRFAAYDGGIQVSFIRPRLF